MPPPSTDIPIYQERVALQLLRGGEWANTHWLHPAGEATLETMAAKGWVEKDGTNGLYRITNDGLAALLRPIPVGVRAERRE